MARPSSSPTLTFSASAALGAPRDGIRRSPRAVKPRAWEVKGERDHSLEEHVEVNCEPQDESKVRDAHEQPARELEGVQLQGRVDLQLVFAFTYAFIPSQKWEMQREI